MVFNWFRRQFTQSEDPVTPPEAPAEPTVETTPEVDAPPEAIASETPAPEEAVQAGYLAWAKAAFQTIQQRQGQAAAPATESLETVEFSAAGTEDPKEALDLDPTVAAETLEEAKEESTANSLTTPESVPSLNIAASPEPESSPVDVSSLGSEPIEQEPTPEGAVALDIPELSQPEPVSPEPDLEPRTPEPIAFDAGFLWSAEVLAAQGRRPEEVSADEITWLQKLRQGLSKTRRGVVNQIKAIVGKGPLNADAVAEIESLLLMADVGIEATDKIIEALQAKIRQEALPPDAAIAYLKQILRDILDAPLQSRYSPVFAPEKNTLNIWLMTGVNGAGKTTTIGKIAHVASESGFNCLVAAADTFRAAAVQQVKVWAQRSNVEVIANPGQNTDPAAVVFDAITAAQSRKTELLLVDTAGRLQNKKNLMDELRKVRQIIDKKAPTAKVESLLVLDATLGQNGLRQAQVFAEAAQLSGVVLTKLDGSAKGGIALAIVQQLGLPIRFIGAGEGIKDLRPFSSYEFVEALLSS